MSQLQQVTPEHVHWKHVPPGSEAYEQVLEDLRGQPVQSLASSCQPSDPDQPPSVTSSRQLYSTIVLAELRSRASDSDYDKKATHGISRQIDISDDVAEHAAFNSRTDINHHGSRTGRPCVSVVMVQHDVRKPLREDTSLSKRQISVPFAEEELWEFESARQEGEICDFIENLIPRKNGVDLPQAMGNNSSLLLEKHPNNGNDPQAPSILRKSKSFSKAGQNRKTVPSNQNVSALSGPTNVDADHSNLSFSHVAVGRTSCELSSGKNGESRDRGRASSFKTDHKSKFSGRELHSFSEHKGSSSLVHQDSELVDGHGDSGHNTKKHSRNLALKQEDVGTDRFERDEHVRQKLTIPAGRWNEEESREAGAKDSLISSRSGGSSHDGDRSSSGAPQQLDHVSSRGQQTLSIHPHPAHSTDPRLKVRSDEHTEMTNGDATSNGNGEAEIVGELGLATSHFRQRSMSDAIVHARRRRLQSSPMPMHHVLMEDVHAHVRWADEEKGSPLATSVLVSSVRPRAFSHGSVDMPHKPILKKPTGF